MNGTGGDGPIKKMFANKFTSCIQKITTYSIYSSEIWQEFNSAQVFMAILFQCLVRADIAMVTVLLSLKDQVPQLRSSFNRVWLRDDFLFQQKEVAKGLDTMAQMVVGQHINSKSPIVSVLTSLEEKYDLEGYFTQSVMVWAEHAANLRFPSLEMSCRAAHDTTMSSQATIEGPFCNTGVNGGAVNNDAILLESYTEFPSLEMSCRAAHDTTMLSQATIEVVSDVMENNAQIDSTADPNVSDDEEICPLQMAVRDEDAGLAEPLVRSGADNNQRTFDTVINSRNHHGQTPLHLETKSKTLTGLLLMALLNVRANVNVLNFPESIPLHNAIREENTEMFEILLRAGAEVNEKDKDGTFPLHLAARRGNTSMVEALLRAGAKVNVQDKDGTFPLHFAAGKGHVAVLEILLRAKADVNIKDAYKQTPLHLAAAKGLTGSVKVLLRAGALINSLNTVKDTPLHCAVSRGYTITVKALLWAGANCDTYSIVGDTPLHDAAKLGYTRVVKALLMFKANVNAQSLISKNTPLCCAVQEGHFQIVKALLNGGAEVNSRDVSNRTPLQQAESIENNFRRRNHDLIVDLLKKNGGI